MGSARVRIHITGQVLTILSFLEEVRSLVHGWKEIIGAAAVTLYSYERTRLSVRLTEQANLSQCRL